MSKPAQMRLTLSIRSNRAAARVRHGIQGPVSNVRLCDIIAALGGAERRLTAVVPNKLNTSETSSMRERRVNPIREGHDRQRAPDHPGRAWRLAVLDLEQTANFMVDMVVPERRAPRPLHPDLGQWRGAGALFDRTDDRPPVSARPTLINRRRPAAGHGVALQIEDAAARARRDPPTCFHVVARKAQAAGLTFYLLGADEAENAAAVASVPQPTSRPENRRPFARLSERRCTARQGRRNQRAGAGLSLGGARRSLRAGLCRGIHPRGSPMSASSRPPAGCSTSCPAAAPVRQSGCSMPASNGPGASGLSRAGCSGVT